MPVIVNLKVTGLKRMSRLGAKLVNKVPKAIPEAIREMGNTYVKDLKNAAKEARIKSFTGMLYGKGIRWDQRPRGKIGRLFIVHTAVKLDSMRPHWVSITPRRTRFLKWGQQASDPLIRNAAVLIASGKLRKKNIFVRPHPFIDKGYKRGTSKVNAILKKHVDRAIAKL